MIKRAKQTIALLALLYFAASCSAQPHYNPEAIRLNNRGVALMGQQFTERAAESFGQAFAMDPKFAQAAVNEGIALLTMQKLDDAEKWLRKAIALDQNSAQAWYNLGLAQHANNDLTAAIASFQHAATIDPKDVDSLYFEGLCYEEMKQYDKAITILEEALRVNPLHASAEFVLARCLQRTGHMDEAREHFKAFQHLSSTKISSPIGLSYSEQGHYSMATPVEMPEAVQRSMIPVQLVEKPMVSTQSAAAFTTTGGACMIDATGSGKMDLALMQSGDDAIRVLHDGGNGTFSDIDMGSTGLRVSGHAVACAVGDYDGDGLNDLAVAFEDRVLIFRNLGHGHFKDMTAESGIVPRNRPTGITFIDYDHDGDLDLFLTGSSLNAGGPANVLWRNNGNGTFTEQTAETGLGGSAKTSAAILTDFNNDRAVDLAITSDESSPTLYVNPREGKFPTQTLYQDASLPSTTGIAVFDYNKDGWMDIAVTHTGAPGLTLWKNIEASNHTGRSFQRVDLPLRDAIRGWGLTPVDIDNDGWIDLAAIVETKEGTQVRVFRNRGNGSFEDVSHALGLDKIRFKSPRGLIAADLYNNGAPDLIVTQENAPPVFLRNIGANKNHFVQLDLAGLADNKTGIGDKIEVYANGLWQKWELAGSSGYQTQAPPQILIGLGDAPQINLLRILWPTGVLQDEIDLPHTQVIAMREADRRGSSCPVLFVWNGHKYKFVTDVIGAAVLGHWFTPTRRNIPNPSEWIKVDGSDVSPVNNKVSVRFMEPMEEANYLDQLRMVAVDHPDNVDVNPDERFLDNPPFASGRVVASSDLRLPVDAWDGEGREVLQQLSRVDHQFTGGFKSLPYDGFANMHALTLDLGTNNPNAPLRLIMTGYVNYFSATSLYAAWQAGIKESPPYVEAQLPDGTWKRVLSDAGFPAGQERTIVVDLSGKLPLGTRRIRLMTNLQIYWDQVLIDQSENAQARTTEMPLSSAALRFRGYPKQIDLPSPGDLDYNYNLVSLTGSYQHERGSYTHYGDVTSLVQSIDNRFVVFGTGEEVAAEFDTSNLPALPAHWKRDYFFYANGFEKDMDWWDASPYTVSQMPFHGMSTYPYPAGEKFPDDDSSLTYQLDWNNRFETGDLVHSYRFDFKLEPSTPKDDLPEDRTQGARQ